MLYIIRVSLKSGNQYFIEIDYTSKHNEVVSAVNGLLSLSEVRFISIEKVESPNERGSK